MLRERLVALGSLCTGLTLGFLLSLSYPRLPSSYLKPALLQSQNQTIFCWILTGKGNHESKARHVRATWVRHCDGFAFISSWADAGLGAVDVGVGEGRDRLWAKTKAAFTLLHRNHSHFHWFLKADDDTYVVLNNLRHFLRPYDHRQPLYFGAKFKMNVKNGWLLLGLGNWYVLSREAVRRFVDVALPNASLCRSEPDGDEDTEIGRCLQNVDVKAADTRDELGRLRFFPSHMANLLFPNETEGSQWITHYSSGPAIAQVPINLIVEGWNCCSLDAISIHNVKPKEMYLFEYFLYRFKHHE